MSTQINVTVQRGDLVERAKAEQERNRRQKLEADARRKVAAQARAAREQAQPPVPERLPSVAGRRDELAAQRESADRLIFAWSEEQKATANLSAPETRLAWVQFGSQVAPSIFYPLRNNGVFSLRAFCGNGAKAVKLVEYAYPNEAVPVGSGIAWQPNYTKVTESGTGASTVYAVTAYMSRTFRYAGGGTGTDVSIINLPTGGDATIVVGQFVACGYTIDMTGNTSYSSGFKPTLAEAQAVVDAVIGREDVYSFVSPTVDGIETTVDYRESLLPPVRFAAVISTKDIRLIPVPQYFNDLFDAKGTKITRTTLNIFLGLSFVWKSYQVPRLTTGLNQYRPLGAPPYFGSGIGMFEALNSELAFTDQIQTFPVLKIAAPNSAIGAYKIQADGNFTDKQMFDTEANMPYYVDISKRSSASAPFGTPRRSPSTCLLVANKASTNQEVGTEMRGPSYSIVYTGGQRAYCRQMLLALGFSPEDLTP